MSLPNSNKLGNYVLSDFVVVEYKGRRLVAPLSFANASDGDRAKVCNGTGPAGKWYSKFIPERIIGEAITAASDIHDWMYDEHIDKFVADLYYLINMTIIINDGEFLDVERLRIALDYYIAVSFEGQGAFDAAGK